MGIGKSATEEKIFCPKTGVGLNFDHINYHFGTMNDYPVVQCRLNESHLGYGTYGAFGIGENIGASMAAITSSAIYNATGKWILDYPITPDKVLKALGTIYLPAFLVSARVPNVSLHLENFLEIGKIRPDAFPGKNLHWLHPIEKTLHLYRCFRNIHKRRIKWI